jgi:hypothetical protein
MAGRDLGCEDNLTPRWVYALGRDHPGQRSAACVGDAFSAGQVGKREISYPIAAKRGADQRKEGLVFHCIGPSRPAQKCTARAKVSQEEDSFIDGPSKTGFTTSGPSLLLCSSRSNRASLEKTTLDPVHAELDFLRLSGVRMTL